MTDEIQYTRRLGEDACRNHKFLVLGGFKLSERCMRDEILSSRKDLVVV